MTVTTKPGHGMSGVVAEKFSQLTKLRLAILVSDSGLDEIVGVFDAMPSRVEMPSRYAVCSIVSVNQGGGRWRK